MTVDPCNLASSELLPCCSAPKLPHYILNLLDSHSNCSVGMQSRTSALAFLSASASLAKLSRHAPALLAIICFSVISCFSLLASFRGYAIDSVHGSMAFVEDQMGGTEVTIFQSSAPRAKRTLMQLRGATTIRLARKLLAHIQRLRG